MTLLIRIKGTHNIPRVHKHHFALETGICLTDPTYTLQTFPIQEENGELYLEI